MKAASTVLVLATLLFAGCAERAPEQTVPWQDPATIMIGDWWSFVVADQIVGDIFWITVVVTDLDPLEFSINESAKRVLLLPGPPVGIVAASSLGFQFQGELFEPIQLPPTEGATWTTTLQGNALEGRVVRVDGEIAAVELHGPASDIYGNYSVSKRMFLDFDNKDWVAFTLADSGRHYGNPVVFPAAYEHVINHGRIVGGANVAASANQGPLEFVLVADGYDDIVGVSFVGSVLAPDVHGTYSECVGSPMGKEFCTMLNATETPTKRAQVWDDEDPAGQWVLDSRVAGPGVAYTQAVAARWEVRALTYAG